jgi:two-component system CheB/CheR fusion protein
LNKLKLIVDNAGKVLLISSDQEQLLVESTDLKAIIEKYGFAFDNPNEGKVEELFSFPSERMIKLKNGLTSSNANLHISPFKDSSGKEFSLVQFELVDSNSNLKFDEQAEILFEESDQAICVVDKEGTLTAANYYFNQLTGTNFKVLENRNIYELIDPEFHTDVKDALQATLQGIARQLDVAITVKNSRKVFLHIATLPAISNNKINGVYCIVNDTTLQLEEAEDKQKIEQLIEKFNATDSLAESLQNLIKEVAEYIKLEIAEFWITRQDKTTRLFVFHYPDQDRFNDFLAQSLRIILEEEEQGFDDFASSNSILFYNENFPRKALALQNGIQAGFTVPVMYKNKRLGTFTFLSTDDKLNRSRIKFVKRLSSLISTSLENRRRILESDSIFELIPDMLCIFDKTGKFYKTNKAFNAHISSDVNNFNQIFHTSDVDSAELINLIKSESVVLNMQARILTSSGLPLWTEWSFTYNPSEALFYGVASNIQSRKLYDLALRADNEKFYLLGKSTQDALYERDFLTGKIEWGNGFSYIFDQAISPEAEKISFWENMIDEQDRDRVLSNFKMMIYREQEIWSDEYRIITADGKIKHILDRGTIVYSNKKVKKVIGTLQDISAIRKHEEMLTELNDSLQVRAQQLIESNKDLENFAYIVSHDLQEPLRMISSFLKILRDNVENRFSEKELQYIGFALDGTERMKRMINDLLTYARVGTNEDDFELISLNEVVEEVLTSFRPRIEAGEIQIVYQYLPTVKAVKVQLNQLFHNLIGNAIKYNESPIPKVEISYVDKGSYFEFQIKDNGIGIDEQHNTLIYTLFKRLHSSKKYSGTGIGLAICKKIIERHKGKIWVKSKPGEGSTFYFTLPKHIT